MFDNKYDFHKLGEKRYLKKNIYRDQKKEKIGEYLS